MDLAPARIVHKVFKWKLFLLLFLFWNLAKRIGRSGGVEITVFKSICKERSLLDTAFFQAEYNRMRLHFYEVSREPPTSHKNVLKETLQFEKRAAAIWENSM